MAELKQTLFTYLAHRHIDLMPPDVADRFDDYRKNSSFIGHMKDWNEKYYGADNPIQPLETAMPPTDPNFEEDWKKLYYSCQKTLQSMYENKKHSVGISSDYNPATQGFIDRWFGDDTKTFTYATATSESAGVFKDLATFLKSNPELTSRFTKNLPHIFETDKDFEKFCSKLEKEEYNKDPAFKEKLRAVIQYIRDYGPESGSDEHQDTRLWPRGVGYTMGSTAPGSYPVIQLGSTLESIKGPTATLNSDPDNWYEILDLKKHIEWFQTDYVKLFDEILTNSVIRAKFLEKAEDPIAVALQTAITDTDYENKESDDFVPVKLTDSKNWYQRLKKWKNDTYENYFRRFTNPSRGTRLFFSPHSQNIIKGFDKAGIKPTDGLDGILQKKDDAKLKNIIGSDPNTRKHFDWFTKKLEELKKETPDDFEGALRDGSHLQKLVINIIIMASKDKKMDEAMTALEVLSVAKYGLLCSRTFNKIQEATKDLKILSDDKLSFNKGPVKDFTKAIDNLVGLTIRGVATGATCLRNFVSHRRTKIDRYIGKYKNLNERYKQWQQEDQADHQKQQNSNAVHKVETILADLDNPLRSLTSTPYKTQVQINKDNIGADDKPGTIKGILKAAHDAVPPHTSVTVPGVPTPVPVDLLQDDVDLYDDAHDRLEKDTQWRDKNPDIIRNLVAYWNFLETATKTHSFSLGNMKLKRDNMLKNFNLKKKTSEAQKKAWEYIEQKRNDISYAA